MDPRLLRAYEDELGYLREAAREFGEEHDGAASYLGLKTPADPDPYVERLLEGVAFLAARVSLKQQDQFPEFTQHLLQAIQPNYLAPTPSICVVGLEPREGDDALVKGVLVPRGSELVVEAEDTTPLRYRTGHDVRLYPLRIDAVEYLPSRTAIAAYAAAAEVKADAGLKIRFRGLGAVPLNTIAPETLPLYLAGSESVPGELYRQLLGETVAVVGQPSTAGAPRYVKLPLPQALGFDNEHALLPHEGRSFRGYRLLAEYFACPERFLFAGLAELGRAFALAEDYCDVVFLFKRSSSLLQNVLSDANFRLFAAPAINLFEMQIDRIAVTPYAHEFQVIPDRTRPLDYEVYRVTTVKAHDKAGGDHPVAPLYAFGALLYDNRDALFYVNRVAATRLSTREQRRRRRSDYVGSETWLSLAAPGRPERLEDIRELSLRALVTNRELPETLRFGRKAGAFKLEAYPVQSVQVLRAPTRPRPPLGMGDAAWRVVAQLRPNFASLVESAESDPALLRDHLTLYGQSDDPLLRRQVDGILAVRSSPVTRRVVGGERMAFARGNRIRITLDDHSFDNARMFLFAAVIDRFLGEFVSVNSFAETVFESPEQGEFAAWPPRTGSRPTI
ncbi:MAG TPA: type VI secretion system baseplate subunit TssF [Rhizomicrobium sp.]